MRKWALLAGVDGYEPNSDIASLKYAGRDALETGRALRDICGFDEVHVLAGDRAGSEGHATANAITDRIEGAIHDLGPDDLFVLGFFMHGTSLDVGGVRREFLLPRDARGDRQRTFLEQAVIEKDLEKLRARRRVLLWDCCRDSPYAARGAVAHRLETDVARDLSLAAPTAYGGAPASTCVLTACSPGGKAYESDHLEHGVFAYHLLRGIRGGAWRQDELDVRALGKFIEDEIRGNASYRQQPRFRQEGAEPIVLAVRRPRRAPAAEAPRPEVEVQAFVVAPIAFDPGKVEPAPAAASGDGIPALDPAVRDLQARLLGLDAAVAGLEAGTHPSLDVAWRQIADALAQMRRLSADRDVLWRRLMPGSDVPDALAARFDPDPAAADLFEAARDPALAAICDYTDRMDVLHAIRNAEQARRIHDAAVASVESAREAEVAALRAQRPGLAVALAEAVAGWLAAQAEADERAADAPFPVERYIPLMRSLTAQLPSMAPEALWESARNSYDADTAQRRRRAADAQDGDALVRRADMQRVGFGVRADAEEAVRLYRLAAERGHTGAFSRLADMVLAGRGTQRDDAEAIRLYRLAADRGDLWAQLNLGFIHAEGRGLDADRGEALRYYMLAADRGEPMARFLLARMRTEVVRVGWSPAEALQLYRLAADQGLPAAQNELGILHRRGAGVGRDDAEARHWFRLAAARGLAVARVNLGLILIRNGEYDEAAQLLRLAAEQGNAAAQNNLGVMVAQGLGLKQNSEEAARLFRLALSQGLTRSLTVQQQLGRAPRKPSPSAYRDLFVGFDRGLQQDEGDAMRVHRFARDHVIAAGLATAAGESAPGPAADRAVPPPLPRSAPHLQVAAAVPRPLPLGVPARRPPIFTPGRVVAAVLLLVVVAGLLREWRDHDGDPAAPPPAISSDFDDIDNLRARAAGSPVAQALLAARYRDGDGVARDYAEALRLYRLAADRGNAYAQFSLGAMYEWGWGVAQDYGEAARFYRLAADRGDPFGQSSLADLYLDGKGMPADAVEAARLYRLSADQGNQFAQCALSRLYRTGNGVPKDIAEADRLFALAEARMTSGCY